MLHENIHQSIAAVSSQTKSGDERKACNNLKHLNHHCKHQLSNGFCKRTKSICPLSQSSQLFNLQKI